MPNGNAGLFLARKHRGPGGDIRYRLHCFPESGNSYKIALLLSLLGQAWEPLWVDYFKGGTRTAAWRSEVNEMGEVPVLEDGSDQLTQSAVIMIHLATRHQRFQAQTESQQYEILRWLFWDNHKFTGYMATYRYLRTFVDQPDESVLAFFKSRVDTALGIAEEHLRTKDFMVGDKATIADLSMCGYLFYPSDEIGYEFHRTHPAIASWLARLASMPGWKSPYDMLPGPRRAA